MKKTNIIELSSDGNGDYKNNFFQTKFLKKNIEKCDKKMPSSYAQKQKFVKSYENLRKKENSERKKIDTGSFHLKSKVCNQVPSEHSRSFSMIDDENNNNGFLKNMKTMQNLNQRTEPNKKNEQKISNPFFKIRLSSSKGDNKNFSSFKKLNTQIQEKSDNQQVLYESNFLQSNVEINTLNTKNGHTLDKR